MELILSDGGGSQSLKKAAVPSRPEAALRFQIPQTRPCANSTRSAGVHRDRVRIDRSARISIERFVLVPRG